MWRSTKTEKAFSGGASQDERGDIGSKELRIDIFAPSQMSPDCHRLSHEADRNVSIRIRPYAC